MLEPVQKTNFNDEILFSWRELLDRFYSNSITLKGHSLLKITAWDGLYGAY